MSQQSMEALAVANGVRQARCELKRQIRAGETTVARVLEDPPSALDHMPIWELLNAQHRWGCHRSRHFLRSLRISELRPVGGLTVRERRIIASRLHMSPSELRMVA